MELTCGLTGPPEALHLSAYRFGLPVRLDVMFSTEQVTNRDYLQKIMSPIATVPSISPKSSVVVWKLSTPGSGDF